MSNNDRTWWCPMMMSYVLPWFNIKIPSWRANKNEIKTEKRLLPFLSMFWEGLWTAGDIRYTFTTASLRNEAQAVLKEFFLSPYDFFFSISVTWLLYSAAFHTVMKTHSRRKFTITVPEKCFFIFLFLGKNKNNCRSTC